VILVIIMALAFLLLTTMGDVLMPVFVALILAYLMQGVADRLVGWGLNETLALAGSAFLFLGIFTSFTGGSCAVGLAPAWQSD
jgi:putative permease